MPHQGMYYEKDNVRVFSYIYCEQKLQAVDPYTVRIKLELNQFVNVEKLEKAGVRVPRDQSKNSKKKLRQTIKYVIKLSKLLLIS